MRPLKTTRQRRLVQLNVRSLEPRIVLDGDVGFAGGQVVLDNFTSPGADPVIQVAETTHNFGAGNEAAYQFKMSDLGDWSKQGKIDLDSDGTFDAEGVNGKLFISKTFLDSIATNGLLINDTNGKSVDVTFGTGGSGVDFSNVDQVTLQNVGDVAQAGKFLADDVTISAAKITLNNPSNDFLGTVTITGASDVLLVDVNSMTLGPVSDTNTLTVTGTTITLAGDITTKGNQTYNGDVALSADVTATLNSNDAGTIKFAGDIAGAGFNLGISSVGNVSTKAIDMTGGGGRGTLTVHFDSDNDSTNTAELGKIISKDLVVDAGGDFNDTLTLGDSIDATGPVAITDAKSLDLTTSITTAGNSVTITTGDDLSLAAGGDITTAGGDVTLIADKDADSDGGITMAVGALVDSGNGKITLTAAESITVSALKSTNAGTAVTITSTKGSVLDGGDTGISATAGTVTIDAGGNIGDLNGVDPLTGSIAGAKALHTSAAKLDLSSGGEIVIVNTGATAIVGLDAKTGGAGSVFLSATGALDASTVTGVEATDKVALLSGATLTLPAGGLAAADLRVEGTDLAGGLVFDADRIVARSTQVETYTVTRNGAKIDAFAGGGLTINANKSLTVSDFTGDGVGASADLNQGIAITAGVVALGTLTVGAEVVATGTGTIALTAKNGGDILVEPPVTSEAGDITLTADDDVIISDPVTSTGGSITITADQDASGAGGVWVKAGGLVDAGKNISISGSDLSATGGVLDSITIDADGSNDQLLAVGDITLTSSATAPVGADLLIQGRVHSTTGNITVDATIDGVANAGENIIASSKVTADVGNVVFKSAVVLNGDLAVTAGAAGIASFDSTIDDDAVGGTTSNLTVTAGGATTFSGKVGATSAIDSLTTNGGGTTSLSGGVATKQFQNYADDVVLGADTTISAGTDVTFAGTIQGVIDGGESLLVTAAGTTTFGGAVGGGGKRLESVKTDGGGTTRINGATIDTTLSQNYADNVVLGADTTLTAGTDVSFGGTLAGATDGGESLLVTALGTTTFGGAVGGGGKRLESVKTDGGGTTAINGGSINTKVDQNYLDDVVVGADAVLTAGTDVTFAGTVQGKTDGGESLRVTAAGTTTFDGAVGGGGKRLESVKTDGGGTTDLNGGSVATINFQDYQDVVVLTADTTLTAGTDVTFGQTVDGTGDGTEFLVVTAAGATTFGGVVGGTTRLESLTTNGGGTTNLNGGAVTTRLFQNYVDNVVLGADTILTTDTDITFGGSLQGKTDGGESLTIHAPGTTSFEGPIGGGGKRLESITTDAAGVTDLNGGAINTASFQKYQGVVVLTADTAITAGGAVSFAKTVDGTGDGTESLTVTASAATTFTGAVGGTKRLESLTTNGGGTTFINGGAVTTSGSQTYSDAVVVDAAANLTVFTAGDVVALTAGDVTFGSTLNGATDSEEDVVVNTLFALLPGAGVTSFEGVVGGAARLKSITTNAIGETHINGGAVTTSGSQTYGDDVVVGVNDATLTTTAGDILLVGTTTLDRDLTVTAGAGKVTFSGDIAGDGAADSKLVVTTSGDTIFGGAAGSAGEELTSLTTNGGGKTYLNGGGGATIGTQTYADDVVVGIKNALLTAENSDVTFQATTTLAADLAIEAGTGAVDFKGAVDDDALILTSSNLRVTASGETTFRSTVGGTASLSSVTTNGGGTTFVNGGAVTTSGSQTYNDAVVVDAAADLTTFTAGNPLTLTAGDVTFGSTLNGAADGQEDLVVNTLFALLPGTGVTSFDGVVGGAARFKNITTNAIGETHITGGAVTTTEDQTYNDAVRVGAGTQMFVADNLTFGKTIDGVSQGDGDIVIDVATKTRFLGPIGSINDPNTLTVTSTDIEFANDAFIEVAGGADKSIHIVANGTLSLGSGFYAAAAFNGIDHDGVATTFVPLPEPGKSNTALFDFTTVPPVAVAFPNPSAGTTDITFALIVGQGAQPGKGPGGSTLPAEKGLQLYLDWGDTILNPNDRFEGPAGEGWPTGGSTVEGITGGAPTALNHSYTFEEVNKQLEVDNKFDVKFAVSHHPSIVIEAHTLTQNGNSFTNPSPTGLSVFTTTFQSDNNRLPSFSDPDRQNLSNGAFFVLVTPPPFFLQQEPPTPELPQPFVAPAAPPPPVTAVNTVVLKNEENVPANPVTVRKQVFYLRALSPDPNEGPLAEVEIDSDVFQSARLKRLIEALPDGAYDIVLRLGADNDRPIIRFDVRMGRAVVPEDMNEGGELQLEEIQDAVRNAEQDAQTNASEEAVESGTVSNEKQPAAAPVGEADQAAVSEVPFELQVLVDKVESAVRPGVSETTVGSDAELPPRWWLQRRLAEDDNSLSYARRLARRVHL